MSTRETDLTRLENLDRVDRERWSKAFAFLFIKEMPSEAIIAIGAGGFQRFLNTARPTLANHEFKFDDYKRMFAIIKAEGERRARVRLG